MKTYRITGRTLLVKQLSSLAHRHTNELILRATRLATSLASSEHFESLHGSGSLFPLVSIPPL
jgi:hypothetical protein